MQEQIAVVSHDAGGAEILSSWLRREGEKIAYSLVIEGPAVSIFQRKLHCSDLVSLENAITKCDWVLCGTSWKSPLERNAITLAKTLDKKVVAFMDHWSNYGKRFGDSEPHELPDEIWVGDREAKALAEKHFPAVCVIQKENPYFLDLQDELKMLAPRQSEGKENTSILYVCEPTGERSLKMFGDSRRLTGYSEKDALQYFLENIQVLGCADPKVMVRMHPSEKQGKYDWVTNSTAIQGVVCGDVGLLKQIVEAETVVGCSSMALVVALLAHKRVVSCIPPGGKPSSLPFPEIEHMQELVNRSRGKSYD